MCMSSKHLQTRRLLHTLQSYLLEVRSMLVQLWREANERTDETFVDHAGVERDSRTGNRIKSSDKDDEVFEDDDDDTRESVWKGCIVTRRIGADDSERIRLLRRQCPGGRYSRSQEATHDR